jgi:hypothetical protein
MCTAENVTFAMRQLKNPGQCEHCDSFLIEKDDNCFGNNDLIWCDDCQSHNYIKYTKRIEKNECKTEKIEDQCDVLTCDSCYNKICPGCDNIGDCVKCDKTLCYDCCETFWCYECENGFCYDCEESFSAIDGIYCKPCSIKLNID